MLTLPFLYTFFVVCKKTYSPLSLQGKPWQTVGMRIHYVYPMVWINTLLNSTSCYTIMQMWAVFTFRKQFIF